MKQFLELQQMNILYKYIGEDILQRGSLYCPYDDTMVPILNDGSVEKIKKRDSGVMFSIVPQSEFASKVDLHRLRYSITDVLSLLPEGLNIYVKHKALNERESDLYEVSYSGFFSINNELIDALYNLFILLKQKDVL